MSEVSCVEVMSMGGLLFWEFRYKVNGEFHRRPEGRKEGRDELGEDGLFKDSHLLLMVIKREAQAQRERVTSKLP